MFEDVLIGKFDIFAVYNYCQAIKKGIDENQAKEYGYLIAVMGAIAKKHKRKGSGFSSYSNLKRCAERKKKKTISYRSYNKIIEKLGEDFYNSYFLPGIRAMVDEGLSYDLIKERLEIPPVWGAKISGKKFIEFL